MQLRCLLFVAFDTAFWTFRNQAGFRRIVVETADEFAKRGFVRMPSFFR